MTSFQRAMVAETEEGRSPSPASLPRDNDSVIGQLLEKLKVTPPFLRAAFDSLPSFQTAPAWLRAEREAAEAAKPTLSRQDSLEAPAGIQLSGVLAKRVRKKGAKAPRWLRR